MWSAFDVCQPAISRRDNNNVSFSPVVLFIPIGSIILCAIIVHTVKQKQMERARAAGTGIPVSLPRNQRPVPARVPSPVLDELLDPPPPYVPLQTLEPVHKPAGPGRSIENTGQSRSMLNV